MATITNLSAGVRAFSSNAFLVTGERPVVVDVGANFDVVSRIREHVDALDAVVFTHTHDDHIGNLVDVRDAFGVPTWGFDPAHPAVDNAVADGETVRLGDHDYVALHTPGHKNDHLCFYSAAASVLFAGDLVFQNGAFGRTDLAEGDRDRLIESIDRVIDRIDPDLNELHTGHGPSVTRNPYEHVTLAGELARQH